MVSKKVISLSLFRHPACDYDKMDLGPWQGRFYERCLPAIVRGYHVCFPGWQIRIHHDESLFASPYAPALFRMQTLGLVELRYMGKAETLGQGSLWRFAPLSDPDVDVFLTRDVDAMPTPREAGLVREWLDDAGSSLHCIHDAPVHGGLMTGMMGVRRSRFLARMQLSTRHDFSVPDALHSWGVLNGLDMNVKESDQVVLNRVVRNALTGSIMFHQGRGAPPQQGDECYPVAEQFRGSIGMDALVSLFGPYHTMPTESELLDRLNSCAPHIGAPFDHAVAIRTYDELFPRFGAQSAIRNCEAGFDYIEPPGRRQRVILACDLNRVYGFFLPITASFWTDLGYVPTILLVGTPAEWFSDKALGYAVNMAVTLGAEVRWVPDRKGFQTSTVAQCVRITAGSVPGLRDDDYVLTGDVDMFPMPMMGPFLRQGNPDAKFHLFYANAYAHEPEPHFPLCYMGGTVAAWRSFIPETLDQVLAALGPQETWTGGPTGTAWTAWNHDEMWASRKIASHPDFVPHVQKIWRDPQQDRLDRAWWDRCPPPAACVDCHALRAGWTEENWPRLMTAFQAVTPMAGSIAHYRDNFVRLMDGDNFVRVPDLA